MAATGALSATERRYPTSKVRGKGLEFFFFFLSGVLLAREIIFKKEKQENPKAHS